MALVKFEARSARVKMPDPYLPGPNPNWVEFMGVPYEPADRAVGDKRTWMGAGRVSNWVDRSVTIHATNIASVPFELRKGSKRKYTVLGQVGDRNVHPVLDILARPNPYDMQDYGDFVHATVRAALLRGEDYWNVVRNRARLPGELYWVSPDMMRPLPDPERFVRGYWMLGSGGQTTLDTSDVYWWRVYETQDRYGGHSRIESLRRILNLDMSALNVQQSVYANGALARGIVSPDDKEGVGFSRASMDEMQKEWSERASGSRNAHSIMFFSKPVKFQELGLKADEAQWVEARADARMAIFAAFGVPKEIGTGEATSYDNLRTARLSLWGEELIPECDWIAGKVNATLVRDYDPDGSQQLYMAHNTTSLAALQPDPIEEARLDLEAIRLGRKTINEVRRANGEDDVPWGNGYWAPWNTADISKSDGTPFPRITQTITVPSSGTLKPIIPSGESDDAIGPLPEPPAPQPAEPPADGLGAELRTRLKAAVPVMRTPEQRDAIGQRHARILDSTAGVLALDLMTAWATQRDAILARLPQKRRDLTDPGQVWVDGTAGLFAAASRMMTEAGTEAYGSVQDQLNSLRGKGRKDDKPTTTVDLPTAISLTFSEENARLRELAAELGARIARIDETTRLEVADLVGEGMRRGYSIVQIAHGVPKENYPGIDGLFSETWAGRELTVARTETAWVFSRASIAAYQDSGVVEGKEWMLGMGDEQGLCQALDGEVVPLDELFSDGSDAPPDPHPNCTCSLLPVVIPLDEIGAGPEDVAAQIAGDEEKVLDAIADRVIARLARSRAVVARA